MSIAEIGRLWPEYEANARLIAAAPDLLEAAKAAVLVLQAANRITGKGANAVAALCAAIAKAEGKEAA